MPAKTRQATSVQAKTVFVILACLITIAAGITITVSAFPAWSTALTTLPLLVPLGLFTQRRVHRSPRFASFTIDGKNLVVVFTLVAGAMHAACLIAVANRPTPAGWVLLAIGLPTLSWAEWAVASWQDKLTKRPAPTPQERPAPETGADLVRRLGPEQQQLVPLVHDAELIPNMPRDVARVLIERWLKMMRDALEATEDYAYLQVIGVRRVSDHCLVFTVQTPPKALVQIEAQERAEERGGKGAKTGMAAFGRHSAEAVAIAVGYITEQLIPRDWVEVIEHELAGVHEVTVLSADVMADVIPFRDIPEWASINTPCRIGLHTNGTPATIKLTGHGRIVAKSESGKTNLLYRLMLYVMQCRDAVPFVCGRRKMNQTFYQLLMKYLGTEWEMPLWLAVGQLHTVHMLWSLLMMMEYRQNLDPEELENLPAIVVFMDEATDTLDDATITVDYHGRQIDASEAVYMIHRGGKSAFIYLVLVTHREVNHSLGNEGADIKAGFDWQGSLMTNDWDGVGRMFDDHKLPKLKHPGELLLAATGHAARRAKVEYVQEVNKRNAPKTDGTTVPEAGWARRIHAAERRLDPGTARAGGRPYVDRYTHVTPEFLEYLRRGPQQPAERTNPAPTAPEQDAAPAAPQGPDQRDAERSEQARNDARRIAEELGLRPQGYPGPTDQPSAKTPAAQASADDQLAAPATTSNVHPIKPPTWPELIVRVLAEHGALPSSRIIELLAEHRPVTNKNAIYNALGAMDGQQITKQADGTYAAA